MSSHFIDVETIAHPHLAEWLSAADIKPAGNLKDPLKIAADIAEKLQKRQDEAALDGKLNRIVCWGERDDAGNDFTVVLLNEDDERDCLTRFWRRYDTALDTYVGFNLLSFDVNVIIMRSWLLGVTPSITEVSQYRDRTGRFIDLRAMLCQGDKFAHGSLSWWCTRFGIQVPDPTTGGDVAAMWAAQDYQGIVAHCQADLLRTDALYGRLHRPAVRPEASDDLV